MGLVAGHRPEKRHDRFIRIIEATSRTLPNVIGVMVGQGALMKHSRELAAQSEAANNLIFLDWQTAMMPVYNALDVIVLTSDTETLPLCFLEAQACGVPVIGMDVGGLREAVLPGSTGYLVAAGDEAAMTSRLTQLAIDVAHRTRMGEQARDFVTSARGCDAMVSQYAQLLEAAMQGRGLHLEGAPS